MNLSAMTPAEILAHLSPEQLYGLDCLLAEKLILDRWIRIHDECHVRPSKRGHYAQCVVWHGYWQWTVYLFGNRAGRGSEPTLLAAQQAADAVLKQAGAILCGEAGNDGD